MLYWCIGWVDDDWDLLLNYATLYMSDCGHLSSSPFREAAEIMRSSDKGAPSSGFVECAFVPILGLHGIKGLYCMRAVQKEPEVRLDDAQQVPVAADCARSRRLRSHPYIQGVLVCIFPTALANAVMMSRHYTRQCSLDFKLSHDDEFR